VATTTVPLTATVATAVALTAAIAVALTAPVTIAVARAIAPVVGVSGAIVLGHRVRLALMLFAQCWFDPGGERTDNVRRIGL